MLVFESIYLCTLFSYVSIIGVASVKYAHLIHVIQVTVISSIPIQLNTRKCLSMSTRAQFLNVHIVRIIYPLITVEHAYLSISLNAYQTPLDFRNDVHE